MRISSIGRTDVSVRVNGVSIKGLLHASISTRNSFSADSFAATFALGSYPLTDIGYWSSVISANVEMVVSGEFGPTEQPLITGFVDTAIIDPIHRTVTMEGRDLSSTLIDSYRQQDFVNRTAAEIVTQIAVEHNLVPVVTSTSGSVGRYYGDGYTRLSLGRFSRLRSDWDLVVQLARENSFDVFVQGRSLFFQPVLSFAQGPLEISLNEVREMQIERTLGIASAPTARVQSWNSQDGTSLDSSAALSDLGTSMAADTSSFLFAASNLTSTQVSNSAARYATELGRLTTLLRLEMPWDLNLAPRQNILLTGTASPLDRIFRIESIDRHYSSTAGSSQRVVAVIPQPIS